MRRGIYAAHAATTLAALLLLVSHAVAQVPRVPFAGIYGGTGGAGSVLAWDRSGGGENPAALGAAGWTASASGHAPFGLEGARVMEVSGARDLSNWGASLAVRTLSVEGASVSSLTRLQLAFRPSNSSTPSNPWRRWVLGASASVGTSPSSASLQLGSLWRPVTWVALGTFAEGGEDPFARYARGGAGMEVNGHVVGIAWRAGIEELLLQRFPSDGTRRKVEQETRCALELRLHALLSFYSGWSPAQETAALGVRFGMGEWEGFSAMRRHAALGGTSLQGIRWRRATPETTP